MMEEILRSFLKGAPGLEAATVDWGSRPRDAALPGVVLYLVSENNGHTHNQGANRATTARVQIDVFATTFGQAKTLARSIKTRLDGYNAAPFDGIFFDSARDLNEEGETGDARIFRTSQDFHVSYQSSSDGFEPVQPEVLRWITIDAADPIGLDVGDMLALDVGALVRSNLPSGQAPTYSVFLGALPSGATLNAGTGLVFGEVDASGLATFAIRAQAGDVFATQTFVVDVASASAPAPYFVATGGEVHDWTDPFGTLWRALDFTASGTLLVTTPGWVEGILAAGGGGGAPVSSTAGGGGGGAGGFERRRCYLPAGQYTVKVGAGGSSGYQGSSSSYASVGISPTVFSFVLGGGRGGTTSQNGGDSGGKASGGGGGGSASVAGTGGAGLEPAYGSAGGNGNASATQANQRGGGGGGYSAYGYPASTGRQGNGGGGVKVSLWEVLEFCGGGGGGGGNGTTGGNGIAVNGGGIGGNGGSAGAAGAANTGGGGGGAGGGASGIRLGGNGGSGRVIFVFERES